MQLKSIKDISIKELKDEGFIESTYKGDLTMLIPKGKLNMIEYGEELYSVDGDKIVYDKNNDDEYINGVKIKTIWIKILDGVYMHGV